MKTYKMKRVVVGILLTILTLGFCVVGTGAAHADQADDPMTRQQSFGPGRQNGPMGQMGGPGGQMGQQGFGPDGQNGSMNQQQGFGPDGQNGPMDQQGFGPDGQNNAMGGQGIDGQTPPDGGDFGPNGENASAGSGPDVQSDSDKQFSRDGGFGPDHQRGFGGFGGPGRDGGPQGTDSKVREAINALEDGETKTNLETLMENVHTAMEALHDADDDSREAAEAGVKEARDALNTALEAAGIDAGMNEAPEKPADGDDTARPEDGNQNRPENGGRQNGPAFLNREALEGIDLEDEEQVENLFQQFLTWIKGSST